MSTQLSIVNSALRFLGENGLSSLEDETNLATTAKASWNTVVDWCLRIHPWNFAQKWEVLARLSQAPPFKYAYAYQLPADCLLLVDIHNNSLLEGTPCVYEISVRQIYTNAETCYARYIHRVNDITIWPSDFQQFVAYKLALDMTAMVVPIDTSVREDLDRRVIMAMEVAMRNDGKESAQEPYHRRDLSKTIQSRYG